MKKLIALVIVAILLAGLTGLVMARCVVSPEIPIMVSPYVTFEIRSDKYDVTKVDTVFLEKLNGKKIDPIIGEIRDREDGVLTFDIPRRALATEIVALGIEVPSDVQFRFGVLVKDGDSVIRKYEINKLPVA